MPTPISRHEVQNLMNKEDALLVEVLPVQEYEEEHIRGAVNIPLKRLDRKSTNGLDRDRPIIVY